MKKFNVKKISAMLLSTTMLLSAIMTAAVPVSAKTAFTDADEFYKPYPVLDIWTSDTAGNKPVISTAYDDNDVENGVHIQFNGGDVGRRCDFKSHNYYNIDDFAIRIKNLKKTEGYENTALRFTILFDNSADALSGLERFRIQFDTDAGTIGYFNSTIATPVVVATNDLLKYDVLSQNEFVVGFNVVNGTVRCTVSVGALGEVNGDIPESFLCVSPSPAITPNRMSTMKIAPGKNYGSDDYHFSMDITGIKEDEYWVPTSTYLDERTASFNSNQGTVVAVNNSGRYPQGRRISYAANKDVGVMAWSTKTIVDADGISFKFNDLAKLDDGEKPQFTVCLNQNTSGLARIRVMLDTKTGEIGYWSGRDGFENLSVIGTTDGILYENLVNKEFSVTFNVLASEDAEVIIIVGGKVVGAYTLPKAYWTKYITDSTAVNYSFGPGKNADRGAFTVNFCGILQTKTITFVDGDVAEKGVYASGENSIVTPKIPLNDNQCIAFWTGTMQDTNYSAICGDPSANLTANSSVTLTAVRREYGDADNDGEIVSSKELTMVKKYLLGVDDGMCLLEAANVDADNAVTVRDLIRLKKYFAGMNVELGK